VRLQKSSKQWVVDCRHTGRGASALKYLSRYLYRGVISEDNIIADNGTEVTFKYRCSQSGKWKTRTLAGAQFLRLLFRHVLPKGLRRVRDYGFLHGNAKRKLQLVQLILKVLDRRNGSFNRGSLYNENTLILNCAEVGEVYTRPRKAHYRCVSAFLYLIK